MVRTLSSRLPPGRAGALAAAQRADLGDRVGAVALQLGDAALELRACAVHATELLVAAHGRTTAAAADHTLWLRGGEPRYKARPRHRARTVFY